jgi:hypothetical protein
MNFWLAQSDLSSNNHLVHRRLGPKQYDSHNVMYTVKPDDAYWADFVQTHAELVPWVSKTTYIKHKPFWLKPHKWLTCKCPSCHEMDCFLKAFVRNAPAWHKLARLANARPANTAHLGESAGETHCWHCRLYNPLYRSLAVPSFVSGDLNKQGGSGLDALYRLCVCEHAHKFDAQSTLACAATMEECSHGAGVLFRGHARSPIPDDQKESKREEEKEAEEDRAADGVGEDNEHEVVQLDDAGLHVQSEAQEAVRARRTKQMIADCAARGVWPIQPGAHGCCPVLEAAGPPCKWREYQWVDQSFVDREGKHQQRKNQVLVEMSGTRQEFLATFKRKLLSWLPHKRHLLWDEMWYQNSIVDDVLGCERVRTMLIGDVHARLDFIKNADLRSPHQAQREYFISIGLSLLCAVVQWKVINADATVELHSRTVMFMSDDRKHDGAFAAWGAKYLVSTIIPSLPGLSLWSKLVLFSDNGPHFAQTYAFRCFRAL